MRRLRVPTPLRIVLALSATLGHSRADPVDDLVRAEMADRHLPSVAVAVVQDGKLVKSAAYGLADIELGVAATPQSVFQIQSITKTFTSAAILQLVEEGRLGLEDPVSRHLAGTPDIWKDITLRHLLSHTSGIRDFINEPTASLRLEVTEEEVLRAAAERPLHFAPGERYAYSNTNYHLLAMILRRYGGAWYGEVLKTRIFEPLGLTHTRPLTLTGLVPGRVTGYSWDGREFRRGGFVAESILSYGGGGVLSTAEDLTHWAAGLLDGKVLRRETLEQAWTPTRLNQGGTTGYGLGWGVTRVAGHREVGHNGAHGTGFTSSLVVYPEHRLAVAVLDNRSGANPQAIARRVAAWYVPELSATTPRTVP